MENQAKQKEVFVFDEEDQNQQQEQSRHQTEQQLTRQKSIKVHENKLELMPTRIAAKKLQKNILNRMDSAEYSADKKQPLAEVSNLGVPKLESIEQGKKRKKVLPPISRMRGESNYQLQNAINEISQKPFQPEQQSHLDLAQSNVAKVPIVYQTISQIADKRIFLESRIPEGMKLTVMIKTNKSEAFKFYPQYDVYLNDNESVHLMSAKKMPWNLSSTYVVSETPTDFKIGSGAVLSKIRSNFSGTEFLITDQRVNSQKPNSTISKVLYKFQCFKDPAPREMSAQLFSQTGSQSKILISKKPKWDEKKKIYIMKFNKRIKQSSVKNFILIGEDDEQVLQFGKVTKGVYTLDATSPLTPLQAFAIALTSCDSKLVIQ